MQRKNWIFLGVGLLTRTVGASWAFVPGPIEVEVAPATVGHFEMAVGEDAKTRLADRYVVSAPLTGGLSRIGLREGDAVVEGATVAVLTPSLPEMLDERSLEELKARLGAARASVEAAPARHGRARVALGQARNDARRSEQLALQGFIAATQLEADRLVAQAAAKEVKAAAAERLVASHEVQQAQGALSLVSWPQGGAVGRAFPVRSPVAGQVLRVLQTSEAAVFLGTPLLELGDTAKLEIVAELLTSDALAARPGSAVQIERWGGVGVLQGG